MSEIIKSFTFEAEKVEFSVYIKKELQQIGNSNPVRMFIDAELVSNNKKIDKATSNNGQSVNTCLTYKNKTFFWIKYNPHQGFLWDSKAKNQIKNEYFNSVKEMQEKYIHFLDIIPQISAYFYDCIKSIKKAQLLFDINTSDIEPKS